MRRPVRKNFWANVSKSDEPDGCWLWLGSRSHGYGSLEIAPRRRKMQQRMPAHRFAWTLVNGPIPRGMCVCHKCDNPPCVRPAHLFLGTVRENSLDMVAKGRNRNQSKPKSLAAPAAASDKKASDEARTEADFERLRDVPTMPPDFEERE